MSTLQHLPRRSDPSSDAPSPAAQPNDHNNLRQPGAPPRVSPDRAASGPNRGHTIMTKGLPSKAIPSSWRAWRSLAPSREPRITNHPLASHQSRQTTTAKESTTSPRAHRPDRTHRATIAVVTGPHAAPPTNRATSKPALSDLRGT